MFYKILFQKIYNTMTGISFSTPGRLQIKDEIEKLPKVMYKYGYFF